MLLYENMLYGGQAGKKGEPKGENIDFFFLWYLAGHI